MMMMMMMMMMVVLVCIFNFTPSVLVLTQAMFLPFPIPFPGVVRPRGVPPRDRRLHRIQTLPSRKGEREWAGGSARVIVATLFSSVFSI